jgi:alpha-tubulin suppressor-like RCC1 family protein
MSAQSRARVALVFMLALAALLLLPAVAAAVSYRTAATESESFVIKSDGTLWSWGGNYSGNLGTGDGQPTSIPVQVGSASDWMSIVSFPFNGMIGLRSDGSLWRWGQPEPSSPTSYSGVPGWAGPWQQVTAGDGHVLLLTTGGELWAMGGNTHGELGNDTPSAGTPTPFHVGSWSWKSLGAGSSHSLGVRSDGTLWAWGGNESGQLGLGSKDASPHASPTQIGSGSSWKAVFCWRNSSYALTVAGDLYAWGSNEYGRLGIGSDAADVLTRTKLAGSWADVAPGSLHCMALRTDGSLWGCGYNYDGALGLAPSDQVTTITRVGSAASWADVAVGTYHTVAVTTPGTGDKFAACGGNAYGQLGLGYSLYRPSPEQVGTAAGWAQADASLTHTAGIRDDHSLWTWGYNISGGLGGSGGLNAPARVGFDNDWAAVSCGAYTDANYTMALKTSGTLWAFGDNGAGQLGLGDKVARGVPTQVGSDADWTAVAASDGVGDRGREILGDPYTLDDHTLAIKADGSLWAWGANDYGQLGLGADTSGHLTPVQVGLETDWAAVACGDDYSAALKTDGSLWVWGHNQFQQLGQGGAVKLTTPTRLLTGTGAETFSAFACGSGSDASHMLAVKKDGTLWGWGTDRLGELGLGTNGTLHTIPPTKLMGGTNWKSVACGGSYGDNYSLAVTTTGELWTWGGNYRGQLGNGDFVSLLTLPTTANSSGWSTVVSGSDSFGLKSDGTLWSWGDNSSGQLGLGDLNASPSTAVYPLQDFVDDAAPAVSGTTLAAVAKAGASARRAGSWTRTVRTIKVKATDTGSGVGRTQISLTGGVSYLTRGSVTVRNGDVTVYVRAMDRKGNTSPKKYLGHWKVDTMKPKPAALGTSVKRGSTAKLKYRIADYSPCTVKIAVKNARGKTMKSITVRSVRPMSWLTASFRCKLAKGTYRWYVSATDSVGYKQVKPAIGKLVVK